MTFPVENQSYKTNLIKSNPGLGHYKYSVLARLSRNMPPSWARKYSFLKSNTRAE